MVFLKTLKMIVKVIIVNTLPVGFCSQVWPDHHHQSCIHFPRRANIRSGSTSVETRATFVHSRRHRLPETYRFSSITNCSEML